MDNKKLQKGYTTGVHTSFAFRSALDIWSKTNTTTITKTVKNQNDDLDVTKGCTIVVTISNSKNSLELNNIKHNPYKIVSKNSILYIYAGVGVGVVTKDGLKPPKNHPAINPVPLKAISDIFLQKDIQNKTIYCSVSIENGENIAKNTANSKVGVLQGLSILGTKGYVKPISATAYINSIAQELNFAKVNGFTTIIFTLGNNALKNVQNRQNDPKIYIIEIGNFIYDGIKLAVDIGFIDIELHLGIAKAIKIAQGFKNTHNRFGSIDFSLVQKMVDIDIKDCLTIKRVKELLGNNSEQFDKMGKMMTQKQLKAWFNQDIKVYIW